MKTLKLIAVASLALTASAPAALAEGACLVNGIPVVNAKTEALGAAVTGYMSAGTAQLIALHEYQTEMLISALRTSVSQVATSNEQVSTSVVKANEAAASAYVASDQAMQVAEESERYRSVGYDACGVQAVMTGLYDASQKSAKPQPIAVAAKPGAIQDPKGWYQAVVNNGENLSAQALFNGDAGAAAEYINALMGPPDDFNANRGGSVDGGVFLSEKLKRDARKSVALWTLQQISAEHSSGGVGEAMQEVVDAYLGEDGGETWAAAMSASHERGILLDTVRIEAANLAALALEIQQQQRTELVVAGYALARADKLVGKQN